MSSSLGVECTQQIVHNKASNDSEDVVCWRKKTRDKYLEYKKKKSYISDRREQLNISLVLTRESDPSYFTQRIWIQLKVHPNLKCGSEKLIMNASDNRVSELGRHIVKTVGMKKEMIFFF